MIEERLLKIKAWDKKNHLIVRLSGVDCIKGTLHLEDYILLQFTGLLDKDETEIYEGDILLMASKKYLVVWDEERSGWSMFENLNPKVRIPLVKQKLKQAVKLCHYFETIYNDRE